MSEKTTAELTTENEATVVDATAPESITPENLGAFLQNLIDSLWNKTDYPFTLPPTSMLKADLATAIGAGTLNDKQWIQITDRADAKPLFVQAQGANRISPFGIQIVSTKPLFVVMDYANGYDGETNPFIVKIDEDRKLFLNKVTANDNYGLSTILSKTIALNFGDGGAIGTLQYYDKTITCTGAATGDPVILGAPVAAVVAGACSYFAWVSAANTVTVRFINSSSGDLTPASGEFTVRILK